MMQSSPAAMPKSPEAYQKRNSGIGGGGGGGGGVSRDEEDMLAKRMFHVDTLHVNKEKKWFFETVPNDYDYYPFGAPGINFIKYYYNYCSLVVFFCCFCI